MLTLLNAQKEIRPTEALTITGRVIEEHTYKMQDLDRFPTVDIKDYTLYNQDGGIKNTLTKLKGIPIKAILASSIYSNESPRSLNEFYFVFKASDGYKVVFSWNEIYNTEIGNKLFIITEMNGINAKDLPHRILFISTGDLKTGKRYIKCLEEIEVFKIE